MTLVRLPCSLKSWVTNNAHKLLLPFVKCPARGVEADLPGIDVTGPEQLLERGNFLMRTPHGNSTCPPSAGLPAPPATTA